jgi:pyruvate/2-oxoglutarate dehydrogenase complex dihydrolipoamide acyltransferase (E2) component
MARMVDLIRSSAVPSNLMQSAAKGSLSVPPGEMIEILVYLAVHNKVFSEQAQLTLAGWDEAASRAAAGNANTAKEVLDYLVSPKNLRPALLPALLGNSAVSEASLLEIALSAGRDAVEMMLKSDRVNGSIPILNALLSNPNLSGIQSESIRNKIEPPAPPPEVEAPAADSGPAEKTASPEEVLPTSSADEAPEGEDVLDEGVLAYFTEHANEIAAEAGHAYQPIGGIHEEFSHPEPAAAGQTATATASSNSAAGAAAKKAPIKKTNLSPQESRGSALQKIAKLDIKGRIQLAMKGSKEERSLLIRDGTKIVALAVLESPKISDGEVERFASQKNVLESVLRGIPMKRRFAKNYAVVRNLVFNPRTPLDLSLALMKNMLIGDLRNLSNNKEISDTVRKLATKMFKQKMDSNTKR